MTSKGQAEAEPARWLGEREAAVWKAFRELLNSFPAAMDRQLSQDSALSGPEYMVLASLSDTPDGVLRARRLAEGLDWEASRLSHLLRRMENRGFIRREACRTDARGSNVVLTDTGRTAITAAAPGHVGFVRRQLFDLLSEEEQEMLRDVAARIHTALPPAGPPAP